MSRFNKRLTRFNDKYVIYECRNPIKLTVVVLPGQLCDH